jgi:hypothetical protein
MPRSWLSPRLFVEQTLDLLEREAKVAQRQ